MAKGAGILEGMSRDAYFKRVFRAFGHFVPADARVVEQEKLVDDT